jgi:hypothetical protein
MIMEDNSSAMRYDFRCNLCRVKNVFHCEHDTPYRDQFLGIYDENLSGPGLANNQKLKNEPKTTQNNGVKQQQQGKSNAGAQNQQGKKHENKTNANPDNKTHTNAENKPAKSCTIL